MLGYNSHHASVLISRCMLALDKRRCAADICKHPLHALTSTHATLRAMHALNVSPRSPGAVSARRLLKPLPCMKGGGHRIWVGLWSQRLCSLSGWRHCQQRRSAQRHRQCRMRWLSLPPRCAAHGRRAVPRRAYSLVAPAPRSAGCIPLQDCLHVGARLSLPPELLTCEEKQWSLSAHSYVQAASLPHPNTPTFRIKPAVTSPSRAGRHRTGPHACVQHVPGACKCGSILKGSENR